MSKFLQILCLTAALSGIMNSASACTTILVGKNASADGSSYAARTVDTPFMASAKLDIFPASSEKGTYEYVDKNGLKINLPKTNRRCLYEPIDIDGPVFCWESGINDAGVGISATETIKTNDAIQAIDPFTKSGLREGNIPRLVLPYISSAKEGVLALGHMVEQYGMTAAEAVAFIDNNEIWYLEILSGHQWVAHRLPDDEYACIGNDCLLDFYNPADTENWLGSAGVIDLAKKAGTYTEVDGKFHLALSFTSGKRNYSQLRVWDSRRHFNNAPIDSYNVNTQYEFSRRPDKKIALKDIFALTRDRHENTPFATDVVGNSRPIAIDRTAQSHVLQYKKGNVPVMWSCLSAPEFGVYLPVYYNTSSIPQGLNLFTPTYDENSYSWQLRLISDIAVTNRMKYSRLVRSRFESLEEQLIQAVQKMPQPNVAQATKAIEKVNEDAWKTMYEVKGELITKFSIDTVLATKKLGLD